MRVRTLTVCWFAILLAVLVVGVSAQKPPAPSDRPVEEKDAEKLPASTDSDSEGADSKDSEGSDSDDSDSEDSDSDEPEAFLLVETDEPCTLWIGNLNKGRLYPEKSREIGVDSGSVTLKATSVLVPEAAWTETFELEEGELLEVRVEMAETLVDFRKLERRERIFPDFDTRLMWPIRDNGWDLGWEAAGRHCDNLELGGFDDWRLPTIEELDDLQAMWSLAPYKTVSEIRLSACCPWSSTRVDDTHALNFSFRYRRPFEGHVEHTYDMRALCVRDAHQEISGDPKEIARQRKEQKQRRKERDQRKAEREAKRKGV